MIVGTWQLESEIFNGTPDETVNISYVQTYVFKDGGRYVWTFTFLDNEDGEPSVTNGTYSLKEDILTMSSDEGNLDQSYTIESLNESSLVLKGEFLGNEIKEIYKKID